MAMYPLGLQVTSYAMSKNCVRLRKFVGYIPTFNGKRFYEFELPKYENFIVELNKLQPKVNFNEAITWEFEIAKESWKRCASE